jgi:phosphoribosylamine--glycine ligase/phosphoribosylglycinamide formyltransferase/phosphoribosylformylglycinamidine cyclo-ligase
LPKHLAVVLDASKWEVQDIYKWIKAEGNIADREMLKTFNCGLGMICIVSQTNAQSVVDMIKANGEKAYIVGNVIQRKDEGVIVNNFPVTPRAQLPHLKKKRVAVLLSGSGTNFQAIVDYVSQNASNTAIDLALVISDKKEAEGVARAQRAGITTKILIKKKVESREEYDERIQKTLSEHSIDLVCLAGYMKIMTDAFVNSWTGRMINIHPSILPLFKGMNAYQQALDARVKITGCTVHFVTPEMDAGPIIAQTSVDIHVSDTVDTLMERGKRVEHQTYPKALELVAQEKIVLSSDGNTIVYKS